MNRNEALRRIPSVEKTVSALGDTPFGLPRPLVTGEVRKALEVIRSKVACSGSEECVIEFEDVISECREALSKFSMSRIAPVINGTGVLIHTNLGRSPLGPRIADHLHRISTAYCNVEIDMLSGSRGPRAGFLETALSALCQAESATVVNNCAAALVLILKHLISEERDEVIVSRGELVEIGGGFRVPEILEATGASLVEVGTTNRTRVGDYSNAITPRTALLLKVHRSNFSMEGFVESPTTEQLSELSRKTEIPFVEDLGSGALLPTDEFAPIDHEPTPAEVIKGGVHLVCFSGDKLLGGPQAGIIAGRRDLVRGVKREPFYRAVRPDKLILTVLQETVTEYLRLAGSDSGATPDVPVLRMLETPIESLETRAKHIIDSFPPALSGQACTVSSIARCGGGTMPQSQIPSIAIELSPAKKYLEAFSHQLRIGSPGIVGYIEDDRLRLDLRTVLPHQDETLSKLVADAYEMSVEQEN